MPDSLDSVKALAADYRRWSKESDNKGDAAMASRRLVIAENLDNVAHELETARKRLRPISKEYGDLSDLPEEVLAQLNLSKIDELEQQLRDIVLSADGAEISLDPIIIELYRRHKIIQERRFIMNKLYRMAQKGLIESVDGKKGVYFIPKPWAPEPGRKKDPFDAGDFDDDVPF